jgi:hypothetical protein
VWWFRTEVKIAIKPEVQAIVDRHAVIDWRNPPHEPERVKAAFERYLKAAGLTRAVRWIADPADAWTAIMEGWTPELLMTERIKARLAGWNGMWTPSEQLTVQSAWRKAVTTRMNAVYSMFSAVERGDATPGHGWQRIASMAEADALVAGAVIGWLNVDEQRAERHRRVCVVVGGKLSTTPARRMIDVCEPMIDALEGGAFGHILGKKEVLVLACPALHTRDAVLHREDGPAIEWPRTKLWYWKGINVSRRFVEQPETITAREIREEKNAETRRVMIERFGPGRYVQEMGGRRISRDSTGTLWHCTMDINGENYVFAVVEVVNGSEEPDGTRKRYFLSVPASCRSAIEAVAWTYGMTVKQYRQLKVRT